jgi:nicotinamidase-related amidase
MFPSDVANQYYEAQRLYALGKGAQALGILDAIERQAPNHPEIMHARALCLHATGNLRDALKVCNQLYTMHRDRRGLELRNRWTNPRWAADTAVTPAPPAEAPASPVQEPAFGAVEPQPGPAAPMTLDAAALRASAVVCIGLSAQPRPAAITSDAEAPARLRALGCTAEDYNASILHHHETCVPLAARLLAAARAAGVPVVLIQWGFVSPDGADLSPHTYLRMREFHGDDPSVWPYRAGMPESQPDPALGVSPGDCVLHMTGDDAFTSTNLRFVLHNLEVKNIILLGGPVETVLARTAATGKKRGLHTIVPIDATIAAHEALRESVIADTAPDHAVTTRALIDLFAEMAPPASA